MTFSDPTTDPAELARAAADSLAERTGVLRHDVALVLGSGWIPAADALGERTADIEVTDLPGFLPPAVSGHAGRIRSVPVGDKHVLVFLGRTHLYEGRGVEPVVHGVRTAAAAGADLVILTNACGGLRPGLQVGDPVLIARPPQPDCPLATGRTAVRRPDRPLLAAAARARPADRPEITEGVYAMFPGPHYETPGRDRDGGQARR